LYGETQRYDKSLSNFNKATIHQVQRIFNQHGYTPETLDSLAFHIQQGAAHYYKYFFKYYTTNPKLESYLCKELLDFQLLIKSVEFRATERKRQAIMQSGNAELIQNFTLLLEETAHFWGAQKAEQKEIAQKIERLNALVGNTLFEILPDYAYTPQKDRKRWTYIAQNLKDNELAIELVRIRTYQERQDTCYMALFVPSASSQKQVKGIILGNGKELEDKYLKNYKNCINAKKSDKYSYAQYWQPLAELINRQYPNTQKIYLCPDGTYHNLNLATLQDPQTGKYLSETTDIQLVSNLVDLIAYKQAKKENSPENNIHIIGYPNYQKKNLPSQKILELKKLPKIDTTQRFLGKDGAIALLLGTKKEAENIAQLCQKKAYQTYLYLENEASEENIKNIKKPTILHIATHGYFLQDIEYPIEKAEEQKRLLENPLLRCGLLLAGAEEGLREGELVGKENGVLTAQEALNLNLDNTEMVVLSACETGLGEIKNGEGVYGLQRAFQTAGAKSILMSLWTVSDEATQELMTLFYENWITKQMPKRQAFIVAQKQLRNKFPEPYYWGAFVMVGE
jgi:CHAT domain-containing protein